MSNPNEPSKTNGQVCPFALFVMPNHARSTDLSLQLNSLIGSGKTLVGNAIETAYSAVGGSTEPSSWTTAGQKQHDKGEAEISAAKTQGYVEG